MIVLGFQNVVTKTFLVILTSLKITRSTSISEESVRPAFHSINTGQRLGSNEFIRNCLCPHPEFVK